MQERPERKLVKLLANAFCIEAEGKSYYCVHIDNLSIAGEATLEDLRKLGLKYKWINCTPMSCRLEDKFQVERTLNLVCVEERQVLERVAKIVSSNLVKDAIGEESLNALAFIRLLESLWTLNLGHHDFKKSLAKILGSLLRSHRCDISTEEEPIEFGGVQVDILD